MITRKYRNTYLKLFLPLMESIFYCRTSRDQELVANESNIALYLGLDRHIVKCFFEEMEKTGLVQYLGNKRIFDDFQTNWAMRCYKLIPTEGKYDSTLQAFINNYMIWEPTFTERVNKIVAYKDDIQEKKLKIVQEKMSAGKKLTSDEKKRLKKYEQNIVYKNEYKEFIEILDVINATRPEPFRSKYLNEGRNRETNILCNSYNPEKEHASASEEDLAERHLLLALYFGADNFKCFDTNASIYRLSFALAMKRPLEHDIDVYEAVWKKVFYKVKFNKTIREALKLLLMPIFMSNGSRNAWNALMVDRTDKMNRSELSRKSALIQLCEATTLDAKTILNKLTEGLRRFLGTAKFLEEEIFIHESNLHILMLAEFANRGIKTINVYDGFYFIEGTCDQKLFDEVYDLCTNKLLAKLQ